MSSEREKILLARNDIENLSKLNDEIALNILQDPSQSRIRRKAALLVRAKTIIQRDRTVASKNPIVGLSSGF